MYLLPVPTYCVQLIVKWYHRTIEILHTVVSTITKYWGIRVLNWRLIVVGISRSPRSACLGIADRDETTYVIESVFFWWQTGTSTSQPERVISPSNRILSELLRYFYMSKLIQRAVNGLHTLISLRGHLIIFMTCVKILVNSQIGFSSLYIVCESHSRHQSDLLDFYCTSIFYTVLK